MKDFTLQNFYQAAQRIKGIARRTFLIEDPLFDKLYLKPELLQPTGAFKVRGAANMITQLTAEQRKNGVCTFSTGNHGLAVSYVSKLLGIQAAVCMSDHVPEAKKNAISRAGGTMYFCGASQDAAGVRCKELVERENMTLIPPFDSREIICGQGTIGLEIMEDLPDVDTILVPLSGGGLISGIALAVKLIHPNVRVVGVCMERSAVMYESLKAGRPVELPEEPTLADSLLGGIGLDNQYTFELVKRYVDDVVLLTEREIAEGMRYLMGTHHLIAEGAGATTVSAILSGKVNLTGKTVSVISGGNVGLEQVKEVLGVAYGG